MCNKTTNECTKFVFKAFKVSISPNLRGTSATSNPWCSMWSLVCSSFLWFVRLFVRSIICLMFACCVLFPRVFVSFLLLVCPCFSLPLLFVQSLSLWRCSTSPPGGNQVDGLPPARHSKNLGSATIGKKHQKVLRFPEN